MNLVLIAIALASAFGAVTFGLTFWPISVWAIYRRAKTWIGLDMQAARSRIGDGQVTQESWQQDSFSGQTLVVTYKRCTLTLMFGSDERVLSANVTFVKTI
jgi:hypothetical protein